MSNVQDQAQETTPLLNSSHSIPDLNSRKTKDTKTVFYTTLLVLFLIDTGSAVALPATTALLEDIICQRHYASSQHALPIEIDCKAEPVQGSLTMFRGLLSVIMLLPGLILSVPYAALAERWGLKRVILLSIFGLFLAELWYDLVCLNGKNAGWPVELVYLSPVFFLFGGGPSVGASLLCVLIADGVGDEERPTRFFLMEAAAYSGSVLGFMASTAILGHSLWVPVFGGLGLIFVSFWLIAFMPFEQDLQTKPCDVDAPDTQKSMLATMRTAMTLFKENTSLLILLIGLLLRSMGDSVMSLLIIYASKVFDWSFAQSSYLASLDSTVHLTVLLLLPTLQRLLTPPSPSNNPTTMSLSNHYTLSLLSTLLSTLGTTSMSLSTTPTPFTLSLILTALGCGYTQSIRSILTLSTPAEHRAIIYTVMTSMEVVGTLIGAPVWPLLYRVGLRMAGRWVGLPFLVAGGLFGGVGGTVLLGGMGWRGRGGGRVSLG